MAIQTMLSLYLAVPPPANLTARAGELITAAEAACGWPLAARDRDWVLEKLPSCARDCTGRTVAVFACADSEVPARRTVATILAMPPVGRPAVGLPAGLVAAACGRQGT